MLYVLEITGWEAEFGEKFKEVHFTMPRTSDAKMPSWPHITILGNNEKNGWSYHRYESKRNYKPADRTVKEGTLFKDKSAYPCTPAETLIVKNIAADLGTLARP